MIITGETFTNAFVALQARIIAAHHHTEVPGYVALLSPPADVIDLSDGLFGMASQDLRAAKNSGYRFPDPRDIGTPLLGEYETAQAYSRVILHAIQAKIGRQELRAAGTLETELTQLSLNFRLAEGMYAVPHRNKDDPLLRGLRDYAFDQYDTALRELVRYTSAESRALGYPSALEIAHDVSN